MKNSMATKSRFALKKIQKRINDDYLREKTDEEETLRRKKRRVELALGTEDLSFTSQLPSDHPCDSPEEESSNDVAIYSPQEDTNIAEESCPRSVKTRSEEFSLTAGKVEVSTVPRATQTDISGEGMIFP